MDIRHEKAPEVGPPALGDGGELWHWPRHHRVANRDDVIRHVRSLPAKSRGSLLALYLGANFHLLATEILGRGNAGECGVKPMRIVRQAHQLGAIGFILVHHDPGRMSAPTAEEIKVTREIRRAGEDFDIHLLDHIILGFEKVRNISI